MSSRALSLPWAVPLRLPFWPIALFTLWDFYYVAVRPFDQIAVITFFLFAMAQPRAQIDLFRVRKILLLLCLSLGYIAVGAFQHADAWKPSAGMIEGITTAAIIAASQWNRDDLVRGIRALILIHGMAEIIQIAGYLSFHYILNYQAWLGSEVRTYAAGLGIRATGLFQEPAELSLMMFSLLTLYRLLGGKSAKLELFALFCMWASVSLWGWGATAVFLVLFRPKWSLLALPFAGFTAAYLLATMTVAGDQGNLITNMVINRSANLAADPSANSRYGALSNFSFSDPVFWFGQGVTDDYELYGANGFSFIMAAGGIFGILPFIAAIAWILPAGNKFRALTCVLFMLTAATQWTFVWWYAWMAIASFARVRTPVLGAPLVH